jgi:hypothetical protein
MSATTVSLRETHRGKTSDVTGVFFPVFTCVCGFTAPLFICGYADLVFPGCTGSGGGIDRRTKEVKSSKETKKRRFTSWVFWMT